MIHSLFTLSCDTYLYIQLSPPEAVDYCNRLLQTLHVDPNLRNVLILYLSVQQNSKSLFL